MKMYRKLLEQYLGEPLELLWEEPQLYGDNKLVGLTKDGFRFSIAPYEHMESFAYDDPVWREIKDNLIRMRSEMNSPPDDNPKTKFGLTKPSMSAVPPSALIPLMEAMADGKNKYGLMNWRDKSVSSSVYYDAALRHLMSWYDGEDVAQDSGVHHLGHAMACMAILLDAMHTNNLNDNRPTKGRFSEVVKEHTK